MQRQDIACHSRGELALLLATRARDFFVSNAAACRISTRLGLRRRPTLFDEPHTYTAKTPDHLTQGTRMRASDTV